MSAQPSSPPGLAGAAPADRTGTPAGAPTGAPFRAALRAAGAPELTGMLGTGDATDPTTTATADEPGDDTMASAATQVAFLAHELTAGALPRTRPAKPSDAGALVRAATPADTIDTAAAALTLDPIGAPPAAPPSTPLAAAAPHATAAPGRRAATPTGPLGPAALPGLPLDAALATAAAAAHAAIAAPAAMPHAAVTPPAPPARPAPGAVAAVDPTTTAAAVGATATITAGATAGTTLGATATTAGVPAASPATARATDAADLEPGAPPAHTGLPAAVAAPGTPRFAGARIRAIDPGFAPPSAAVDAGDHPTSPPHFPEADLDPAAAAMLRAAYGAQSSGAPVTLASAGEAAAAAPDSPVDAWLAAAVSRAIGAFGGAEPAGIPGLPRGAGLATPAVRAPGHATAGVADTIADLAGLAAAQAAPAAVRRATSVADLASTVLTPLEQAVRDLVSQVGGDGTLHGRPTRLASDDAAGDPALAALGLAPAPPAAHDAPAVRAPGHTGPAAPSPLPEAPSNPSHVHLVLDDGPERVVATVAVRGSEVHVALRASDDATAAALARNAASLDHAMRGRGLALHDLTAEREPRDQRPSQDAEPRERRPRNTPKFELEEKP